MRINMKSISRPSRSPQAHSKSLRSMAWRTGLLAAVASTSLTGCKSAMPKFNMFGFKREPSAEALAGSGPTSTYPTSPSSGVTPEALASTAAGTAPSGTKPQTANVAASAPPSYGATPSYANATAPATNNAAAAANGFYGTHPAERRRCLPPTPTQLA